MVRHSPWKGIWPTRSDSAGCVHSKQKRSYSCLERQSWASGSLKSALFVGIVTALDIVAWAITLALKELLPNLDPRNDRNVASLGLLYVQKTLSSFLYVPQVIFKKRGC